MTAQTNIARTIVATLRTRERFARKRLRYVTSNTPLFPGLSCTLQAEFAEAHNAAEVARRILYAGSLTL